MNNMFGNLIESPNTNSENIYIKTEEEEEEDSFFIKKESDLELKKEVDLNDFFNFENETSTSLLKTDENTNNLLQISNSNVEITNNSLQLTEDKSLITSNDVEQTISKFNKGNQDDLIKNLVIAHIAQDQELRELRALVSQLQQLLITQTNFTPNYNDFSTINYLN